MILLGIIANKKSLTRRASDFLFTLEVITLRKQHRLTSSTPYLLQRTR